MSDLLPADALYGVRVGISISASPDLDRIGLRESHFQQAVAELARLVLTSGGSLAYGGHLDPWGYTAFLLQELRSYGRTARPMLVCLAWQEHRRLPLSELERRREQAGSLAEIVCLDPDGREIDPAEGRGEAPETGIDPQIVRRALTAMRRYMNERIDGRVLIGGKRHGFQGEIPGLVEEALLALEERLPLYLAGGFGGVTLDIARALGVDGGGWLPSPSEGPAQDPRLLAGLERLLAITARPGWDGLRNGLTDAENRRLAASYRPGEIASLVGLGLGRLWRTRGRER